MRSCSASSFSPPTTSAARLSVLAYNLGTFLPTAEPSPEGPSGLTVRRMESRVNTNPPVRGLPQAPPCARLTRPRLLRHPRDSAAILAETHPWQRRWLAH